ncbi:hypothetical protein [Ferrovibrio xuzhouensis]|uniref:Uncharacterized protein n=1 Tax=Ferrovibrio xuzhouensis TaxID=1576914 RepID=A0ABV7VFU1_9PROT
MPKITKIVEVANDIEDEDDDLGFELDADDSDANDSDGDDDDDAAMSGDLDGLRAVARLAKLAGRIDWFAAVGRPLAPAEHADAADYVAGLGFPDVQVGRVEDWRAAAAVAAETPDWGEDWWQAEEQMRKALLDEALALNPEHDLMVALTHVSAMAKENAQVRATAAAARQGISNAVLVKAAADAAAQAAYQAALVLAADGEADHPFAVKFRLFEAGRLPLGITGSTFNLF